MVSLSDDLMAALYAAGVVSLQEYATYLLSRLFTAEEQ